MSSVTGSASGWIRSCLIRHTHACNGSSDFFLGAKRSSELGSTAAWNISPVSVHVALSTVIDQFPAWPPDQITRQMRMARARWLPAQAPPSGARHRRAPRSSPRRLRPCRLVAYRTGTRPTRARHLIRIRRPWSTVGSPFVRGVAVRGHGECSAVAWHRHRVSPVAAQCGGSGGSVARPRCACRMSTTCVAVRPCWAQRVECPCHSASHGIHSSSFGWNSGTASSASRLRVMEY